MAAPKLPDGWEVEEPVKAPDGWEVEDAPAPGPATGDIGSPLDKALKEQTGDVVTVETPTGPAQFTRNGERFYGKQESKEMLDRNEPAFRQRMLEGALSTLSGGGPLLDEGAGFMAGVDKGDSTGLNAYRRTRDSARNDVASATRNASPSLSVKGVKLPLLPMAGAAIPSMLTPMPLTVLGRILSGGAVGAQQAAGESEADLTRGEVPQFARDVGNGAGYGLGMGGAVEAAAIPARALNKTLGSVIGDVAAGQSARDTAQVAKEVGHLQGVARSEVQKGSRYTENVLRRANGLQVDPSSVSDPVQRRAIEMLDEPGFKALSDSVAENTMAEVPAQLGRINAAKSAASSAAASAAQDASDRTRDYFRQSTFGTQIRPRLTTLAENTALGAAAGATTGGAAGLMNGGLSQLIDGVMSGVGSSALSGGSGLKTLAKNAMSSPLVQTSALESMIRGSQRTQGALQRTAGAMSAVQPTATLRPSVDEREKDAIDAFMRDGI